MRLRFLISFLLLCLPGFLPLLAQEPPNLQLINRREGLSNGAVNTIVRDAEGYMWLGTWNGLNRYDGSQMLTYLPGKFPSSIHNHVVRELYPTTEGPLWMLTNKGVCRYDNVHDRFTPYFDQGLEQINYENDISLGQSGKNGVMVSIFGVGLFRFDTATMQFQKLPFQGPSYETSLSIKRVHLLGDEIYCLDAAGKLWAVSGNRLNLLMDLPVAGTLTSSVAMFINHQPLLLITQRGGTALRVDLNSKQAVQLLIPDDVITTFALSGKENQLWTGTERGRIYTYDLTNGRFNRLSLSAGQQEKNPIATRVLCIFETDPDLLWIGTDGNGAYTLKLEEFPNRRLPSTQLAYPIVRGILLTRDNHLLVGTKGGGIDIFDGNGNHLKNISVKNGLSNNSVLSFHENADGTIWVGTDGQGIDMISPGFKTILNFPRDFPSVAAPAFASVYRIVEDVDGDLYLGTSGYGVIRINFDHNRSARPTVAEQLVLDNVPDENLPQKQIVYALAIEKPGTIWIGSRGMGIYRYNTVNKRLMARYNAGLYPGKVTNDDILSLFTDKGQHIWAGTSNGLFEIVPVSPDSVQFESWQFQSDLQNTSIHAMEADNLGNLWVTTNQGLSLIDPKGKNVRSYSVDDGLINFEYTDGASFFDEASGRLFVGGTMGLDIVQTRDIRFSSYFPPIGINRLLIRNQLVEPDEEGVLQSRINHQQLLDLSYNQNALSFQVAPLAFWGQERYRISYRLKNFDDNWTINPANQPISFTNLPSGDYVLQIRVSDENGTWSEAMRQIAITIHPPFWRTTWAIIGYILLFFGIQWIIFQAYRRREARKKAILQQEFEQKKEAEMQSYKIEFFTNVAHEFRTPLTLITSHIHALIEDKKNTLENPRLLKVYNNSLKLQKLVLEIMQFRKLEKGKEPLNIQLCRPVDIIGEVISDLEPLAQQSNVRCEVIAEDKELLFKTDPDKFNRIFTNLISNAIKYNKPGGFAKATVKMEGQALSVQIEDGGVGIRREYFQKIFEPFGISSARKKGSFPGYRSTGLGLAVTKGLVELLRGNIRFESVPDEGTRFFITFPDVHSLSANSVVSDQEGRLTEISYFDEPTSTSRVDNNGPDDRRPVILLVDDDPEILELLRDFLQSEYTLLFAENGVEALRQVQHARPDLIVSDIMMPEMDGIELCMKLRENFDTSHLPLILLTAKAEIEDRITGLKAGADSYIPKPFHPDHLKVRIEKLLQLRKNIREYFGKSGDNPALVNEIPDPFFQKMLAFIDENIDDESLTSEKLCDKLAISKSSLYNKTKSVLGTTPHGLINQRRLGKAALLLKSSTLTVSEIIDQTGFTSRTHFYDLFSKAYGCSPLEYRGKQG
jgi:signal transduction histidine kinase/CheY-like chemotaxis protein/AraC-like DNA-binding protein/sugar lactone lactonase YvrE